MTNSNEVKMVTITDLAEELFMSPKSLRKKLRDNKIEKPGTTWQWEPNHPTIEVIRNLKNQKPTRKPKVAKTTEPEVNVDLSTHSEPEIITDQVGAWTITIHEDLGIMAQAGKDKTKWMNSPSDIRPSLPKKVKEYVEGLLK